MVTTWTKNMDLNIAAQLRQYFNPEKNTTDSFVTISREFGCDGKNLANAIVAQMNENLQGKPWFLLSREMLLDASEQLTEETLSKLEDFGHSDLQSYIREAIFGMGSQTETIRQMAKIIRLFASRGRVVILGGGGSIMTHDMKQGIHVRYYASQPWRIANHAKRWDLDEKEAHKRVVHRHGEREAYVKTYLGKDIGDREFYHLTINNEKVKPEGAANLVVQLIKNM